MNNFFKKHLATILSILATIVVGYFGIVWSQNQFRKAEEERKDRVKEEIVSIIEEHVINKKPITPSRLNRLTEIKCQNEGIPSVFTSYELLENAEYNLLESRHLDFSKKEEYKVLFDSIYQIFIPNVFLRLRNDSTTIFSKNPELVENLMQNLNSCKTTESITNLETLISIYEIEINSLKKNQQKSEVQERIDDFMNTPFGIVLIIFFTIIYFAVMYPLVKRILKRNINIKNRKQKENTTHNNV